MNKKKLAAFAIIPALGAVALGTSAFAASDTGTSTITQKAAKFMRGMRDNTQFATDLAQVLGLSATDVKAKLDAGTKPTDIITSAGKTEADVKPQLDTLRQATIKAKLAAEVAAGTITQAQADERLAGMANRVGGPRGDHGPRDSTQLATDLASIIGGTATDIKAKLDAGSKPEDLITAAGKNVTDAMAQLKTLRETAMKARLHADVAAGTITQAKADQMIADMANHVGGPRGHHGFGTQTPPTIPTSTQ